MTVPLESVSIETFTLPHEDPREHEQLVREWATAYPNPAPAERVLIEQAVHALIERRRLARTRATLRTQKVRTALLEFERDEEDKVAGWLGRFNDHCPSALVGLLRSAAGCRWAINYWMELDRHLIADGTWYGAFCVGAIQLQGHSGGLPHLYYSETAFTTFIDCLACQPNPKQAHIDRILHPHNVPQHLLDSNTKIWPRDVDACRARLRGLVDRELLRVRALEETLRTQYEEPERAEAQVMALASVSPEEVQLLRAQRIHEQSYMQASTALLKVRGQAAAARARVEQPKTEPTRENMDPWYISRWRPRGQGRVVSGTEIRSLTLC